MENSTSFIETWDSYMIMGSYFFFGLTVLIILFHEIKVMTIANEKDRYDYVNTHEIKYFWYAIITFIIGLALYATATITPLFPVDDSLKTYISVFFLAGLLVITYLLLSSIVRILYPRFLENRLMRIRNKPRKSAAGNIMRKLTSAEGEVHLDADQLGQLKSNLHSAPIADAHLQLDPVSQWAGHDVRDRAGRRQLHPASRSSTRLSVGWIRTMLCVSVRPIGLEKAGRSELLRRLSRDRRNNGHALRETPIHRRYLLLAQRADLAVQSHRPAGQPMGADFKQRAQWPVRVECD